MFDNLRDSEKDQRSFEEAMGLGPTSSAVPEARRRRSSRGLLGLSAGQRLVIALLLLLAVCVLGTMCLLVTGRISAF
ncbi:MAG: hypothetical protein V1755_01335 [Chloroflexota bacterium]